MDGIEYNRTQAISPEVMQILVRVYMSQMSAHFKSADPNSANSTRALEELFIACSDFWSTIRAKVNIKDPFKRKLDDFFYGNLNDATAYKDISDEGGRITFESKRQAMVVFRDLWDTAAGAGITMDFTFILEGYEEFGRVGSGGGFKEGG